MSRKVMLKSLQWIVQKTIATILMLLKWTELWRRGSVVGSWLLDLTATVLRSDRDLANSMGEYQTLVKVVGLFTVLWISVFKFPVITTALFSRFESRRLGRFANKVLNGMRDYVWRVMMSDKLHIICTKCGGKGCQHCNKGWEK